MRPNNFFDKYAPYFSLGLEIALGIALPIYVGYRLDIWLETLPWLTVAGSVVGIVNIFVLIVRMNKKLNEEE